MARQDDEFEFSTASESAERVAGLGLPRRGSEDVSHLLVRPPNLPRRELDDEERDYRPEEAVEWVVDIEFEGDPVLAAATISKAFDPKWLESHGAPTIFGWSPEIKHWTYLVSSDAPKTFTKLALGWPLYKSYDEEYDITAEEMEQYLAATKGQAARLGKASLRTSRSPQEAELASEQIREVVENCDREVAVFLRAPKGKPLDGKEVWDVMLCLGLEWGDGDLFHWNSDSPLGDDAFFSVATTTDPGYFLPEDIASGDVRLGNLVFGYSIPRSADPVGVLDSMLRAVEYAQKRLGGTIEYDDGAPCDKAQMKADTQELVDELKHAGFTPGAAATLHVF